MRVGLMVLGAVSAGSGEWAFGRNLDDSLPLGPLASFLDGIFRYPESCLLAIVLLVAGALLFALAKPPAPASLRRQRPFAIVEGPAVTARALLVRSTPALAGLAVYLPLLLALFRGSYHGWYPLLFALCLGAFGLAFLLWDRYSRISLRLPLRIADLAFVGLVVGVFVLLNVRDLDNWYYSAIGDEYAFFNEAHAIADGHQRNVFSQDGVYGYQPLASSAYQAVFLEAFGPTNFAWKLSTVFALAATMLPFYMLVQLLFGRTAASLATALLASSHYLFAYAHIGYFNVLPLFPTVAAFALFVLALRNGSSLLGFAGGIAAGAGFYTFYSSRAAIVVLALFLLTLPNWPRLWRAWAPLASGFALTALPIFAVSKLDVIDEMLKQSAVSYSSSIVGSRTERVLENLPRTLFAFNHNEASLHFVSGSLADQITAAAFVVGLVYALSRVAAWQMRFMIIWYVVGLLAVGVLSPYPMAPISRLHYLMPVVAALAAVALLALAGSLALRLPRRARLTAGGLALGITALAALALNLHRFWNETPSKIPTTVESVVVRAVFSPECRGPGQVYVVAPETEPLLRPIFVSYDLGSRQPALVSSAHAPVYFGHGDVAFSCLVISGNRDQQRQTMQLLSAAYPGKRAETVSDRSGRVHVTVLR